MIKAATHPPTRDLGDFNPTDVKGFAPQQITDRDSVTSHPNYNWMSNN